MRDTVPAIFQRTKKCLSIHQALQGCTLDLSIDIWNDQHPTGEPVESRNQRRRKPDRLIELRVVQVKYALHLL